MRNPYEVLGVETNVSKDDLKKKYRELAKKYHPDLNPGDEEASEKLKEINEAYAILSDDEKRSKYDRFGSAAFEGGMGGGGGMDFGDIFSDVFGDFFGGGFGSGFGGTRRTANAPRRGADIEMEVRISFEESFRGVQREVTVNRRATCGHCSGSGAEPGSDKHTCGTCHGTGQVRYAQNTPMGQFIQQQTCPDCNGTGEIIEEKCHVCSGVGEVRERKKIKVSIPKGIDNQSVISVRGEGHAGKNGGSAGDLYVVVRVKPHDYFVRRGNDILLDMPISFVQAALGDDLQVPTMDGIETYKLPEETQTGTSFRFRGQGFPDVHGRGTGDLIFTVRVVTPTGLSDEQKDLLRAYGKSTGQAVKGHKKGFFDRVKDGVKDILD